ncbi:MAG: orotate phosphoribosyltransferase [Candidatus Aenigmarchaeota archaeon ex4484_56]|nr:MAG: orotate phosphoribosyltransferase [Candidatus Aenigmarchaeota archaeon ex4484_56]
MYKEKFINFLLENGAFLYDNSYNLESGRNSPYYINTGVFYRGENIKEIGYYYASKITDKFDPEEYDIIFGPAYKGIPLCIATAIALNEDFKINKNFAFNRKEPKSHGESTNQNWIVGCEIKEGDKILIVDDVFTTGNTKYEIIDLLNGLVNNIQYTGIIIAVDRQETGKDGVDAIKQFEKTTDLSVDSIVNINDIVEYLHNKGKITEDKLKEIEDYRNRFGSKR